MTVVAVRSPVTLMVVRHISSIRSTPRMRAIPVGGTPMPVRMVASTTMPTPGIAGVPIEAPTVVSNSSVISDALRSTPNT